MNVIRQSHPHSLHFCSPAPPSLPPSFHEETHDTYISRRAGIDTTPIRPLDHLLSSTINTGDQPCSRRDPHRISHYSYQPRQTGINSPPNSAHPSPLHVVHPSLSPLHPSQPVQWTREDPRGPTRPSMSQPTWQVDPAAFLDTSATAQPTWTLQDQNLAQNGIGENSAGNEMFFAPNGQPRQASVPGATAFQPHADGTVPNGASAVSTF
ncbi:hypothetical protein DB88DRAFT_498893 [Papiliotrema laurentii]|uniref:Uncharacterized protein n=1 Tax=Papiliotrema laurentii TaxID=5418 RepID=A0AAD9CWA0_PAPLA|nr:hypothetical protein DB88DRAFT_498893 [Papiliotrema laurentii]